MHQLFAALFAILISFCHHSPASQTPENTLAYESAKPTPVLSFPAREDLARNTSEASYAGSECLSCQTMTVSYIAR